MNWLQQFYEEGINRLVQYSVHLLIFSIAALCILYLFISKKNEKKAAEEAKKKAEEKKKAEHGKKDDPHAKNAHGDEHTESHVHHGTKQGFVAATLNLAAGLAAIYLIAALIVLIGFPLLERGFDTLFGWHYASIPQAQPAPVAPPLLAKPKTFTIGHGKDTAIVTETWWYEGRIKDGAVIDFTILDPDGTERVFKDVSATRMPEGLHIRPGSKIIYSAQKDATIEIHRF